MASSSSTDLVPSGALTRRDALRLAVACALSLACGSAPARGARAEESTAEALASAEERYYQVQGQIDEIAYEYEQASLLLAGTMDEIELKQGEIDLTQASIDAIEADIEQTSADLATSQEQLASVMAGNYKSGATTALDVIMASSDFDQLFENIYYLNKVSDDEAQLIAHTKEVKLHLEEQQAQLLNEMATLQIQLGELNALREQQEWQLAEMQLRQEEAYILLESLDEEVRALTEQYNAELAAQAAAAAAARAGGGSWAESYGSTSVQAVVGACGYTPSPGSGLCAAWVTNVFLNAGIGYFGGDACDMYASWCYSSDQASIQPGMIVAVSTWTGTSAGRIYGHVGVYIGGGMVMDNIGYIRTIDLGSWIGTYGTTVSPRWGWIGGVPLA